MTKLAKILKLIDELPSRDQILLTRKLEKRTWGQRLDQLVGRMRRRLAKPLSDTDITAIVEDVRLVRHAVSG